MKRTIPVTRMNSDPDYIAERFLTNIVRDLRSIVYEAQCAELAACLAVAAIKAAKKKPHRHTPITKVELQRIVLRRYKNRGDK